MSQTRFSKLLPREHPGIYTFADIVSASGASDSNLTHWLREGALRPDVSDTAGSGQHRLFSFRNLFEATVAAQLNLSKHPVWLIEGALLSIRKRDGLDAIDQGRWDRFMDRARSEWSAKAEARLLSLSLAPPFKVQPAQDWTEYRSNREQRHPDARFYLVSLTGYGLSVFVDTPELLQFLADETPFLTLLNLRRNLHHVEFATGDWWEPTRPATQRMTLKQYNGLKKKPGSMTYIGADDEETSATPGE